MTMRRFLRLLVAALVVTSVVGVAPVAAHEGHDDGTYEPCEFPVTVEDATGEEITIEEPPERVTTINPSAAQTMWEIGGKEQVVGLTQFSMYLDGAAEREDVSAEDFGVSVEKVVATEPDLVLAPNASAGQVEPLRDAGLTVYHFREAKTVDDIAEKTTTTGRLTGNCEGAAETVDEMQTDIQGIRALAVHGAYQEELARKCEMKAERDPDLIVSIDADLQFDPADIERFVDALKDGADVVTGWRTNRRDIDPSSKTLPSRIFNAVARRSTDADLHDLPGGMRGVRRGVVDQVPVYGDLHRFLPIMADKFGLRVTEVPIEIRERRAGETKYGARRLWSGVMDLIKVLFLTTYHLRPFHVFGSVGLLLMLAGFTTGSYLVVKKFALGISLFNEHGPLLILVSLAFTSGLNLFFMGLLGEMVSSLRGQDRTDTAYREL